MRATPSSAIRASEGVSGKTRMLTGSAADSHSRSKIGQSLRLRASVECHYSSLEDMPPKCGFFLLPFFGGWFAGRLLELGFGFPRIELSRSALLPELLRVRPAFPPFMTTS